MFKNLSGKHYQQNKERLQKEAHERYQNLSKKGKGKKRLYGQKLYKTFSEDDKNNLVEYYNIYAKMRKKR